MKNTQSIQITIVYDNNPLDEKLDKDWGFSCFIKGFELLKKDIHIVLGGFHLAAFYKNEINEIIDHFRKSGVKKVGPGHCSGDDARRLFAEEYKDDFIEIGVGKEIKVQ